MTDLIKRLRESYNNWDSGYKADGELLGEAADALEAAYFSIAELEAKCRLYEASLDKADAERDALAKDSERYRFLAASAFKHLLPTAETIDAAIAKEPK
jgi:multidrug resistance efflux pump